MTYDTVLICLNRSGDEVIADAEALCLDNSHIHITGEAIPHTRLKGAQILAAAIDQENGPTLSTEVYESIREVQQVARLEEWRKQQEGRERVDTLGEDCRQSEGRTCGVSR